MDTHCTYHDRRDEILIGYLYNDIDAASRAAFEVHLAGCVTCRDELEQLGIVRVQLEQWTPPEPARAVLGARGQDLAGRDLAGATFPGGPERIRPAPKIRPGSGWARLGDIPAWAQVAAAMLFLGVSAAVANLDIAYDSSGLSVRTGWMTRAFAPTGAPAGEPGPAPRNTSTSLPQADDVAPPWRAELVALERQLRDEMRSSAAQPRVRASAQTDADAETMLVRVRALIEESEQRQQRELALRIAEVDNNVRAQRIADLRNIDRNLTVIQSNTGVDMRRLYQMTNDLAVRVSQTR